jgi:hypothetical protein
MTKKTFAEPDQVAVLPMSFVAESPRRGLRIGFPIDSNLISYRLTCLDDTEGIGIAPSRRG